MSAPAQARPMTADELLALPDDGMRHELIEGELRTMAPAGHDHGVLALRAGRLLGAHVDAHGLGLATAAETGYRIASDPDTVLAPDAAFVSRERVASEAGYWAGAPDLAIEVVSPSDTYIEVQAKALRWLDAGCRLVLTLDSRHRTVTTYRSPSDIAILDDSDTLDASDVVDGWTVRVSELLG